MVIPFSFPPYATRSDTLWTPPFVGSLENLPLSPLAVLVPVGHDPPEKVETFVPCCFTQTLSVPSSFTPGHALKAMATVLPYGHHHTVEVMVGVDTLSDVNLCVRDLLSNVHLIRTDVVRGNSSLSPFDEEGTLYVISDGTIISVPALISCNRN